MLTDLFDASTRRWPTRRAATPRPGPGHWPPSYSATTSSAPIARNVIKLWYAGIWFELPPDWTDTYGALPTTARSPASPQAYPEALLWRAIGSNPPGAKAPGYGSWAFAPVFPPIPVRRPSSPRPRRPGRHSACPSRKCHCNAERRHNRSLRIK